MSIILQYLLGLIITILIEFFIIWILLKKDFLKLILYSVLINSFTLPIATYSYQNIIPNFYVIEMLVIFVESILIMLLLRLKYPKAFFISLIANLITALISLMF